MSPVFVGIADGDSRARAPAPHKPGRNPVNPARNEQPPLSSSYLRMISCSSSELITSRISARFSESC
jgi:hypothetical protein